MTSEESLQALRPDPLEPRADEVERYVGALRDAAGASPALARREAWEQIRLAGARAGMRRAEALDTLNRLFRLGGAPPALEGPYRGILVTPSTFRALDPVFRTIAAAWMPWVGKRFDASAARGDNLLLPSARVPARVFWPGYRLTPLDDGRYAAFRFRTYVAPGKVDPDRQTLKIDYDSDENPGFLIRDILDELVEVVPGAYLGKVLLRRGDHASPAWRLVGYFALEPPATGREPEAAAVTAAPTPA
jgi:hypothetical protein